MVRPVDPYVWRRLRHFTVMLSVTLGACGEEDPGFDRPDEEICLDRRDGGRYCIFTYEASHLDAAEADPGSDPTASSQDDVPPWVGLSWAAARAACEARGKRLCEADEWIDACDGVVGEGGTTYAYGDERDPARCNLDGGGVENVGQSEACRSATGTFDQSGNVWEWTGNTRGAAAARGGGFRSSAVHACDDVLMGVDPAEESEEIGFRCCRDA